MFVEVINYIYALCATAKAKATRGQGYFFNNKRDGFYLSQCGNSPSGNWVLIILSDSFIFLRLSYACTSSVGAIIY